MEYTISQTEKKIIADVHADYLKGEDLKYLRDKITENSNKHQDIVMNLKDVNHIDSLAIGHIIDTYKGAVLHGQKMKIYCSQRIKRKLVAIKLDSILPIE